MDDITQQVNDILDQRERFNNNNPSLIPNHVHNGTDSPQVDYNNLSNLPTIPAIATSVIPYPDLPFNPSGGESVNIFNTASNTTMWVGKITIPLNIICKNFSFWTTWISSSSEAIVATLYAEDGQSQIFTTTIGTLPSSQAVKTSAMTSVNVPAGHYYIGIVPTLSSGPGLGCWENDTQSIVLGLSNSVSGKAVLQGTLTVSAGVAPSTIDPTAITSASNKILFFRLDT